MKPNDYADQAHADIRELFAQVTGNYEPTAEEVDRLHSDLTEILKPMAEQIAHWKANHADMVVRNKVLAERPDLPVDRIPVYLEVKRMQEAHRKVEKLLAALTEIRDEEFGSRHHTDVAMEALAEFGCCDDELCPQHGQPHAHVEVAEFTGRPFLRPAVEAIKEKLPKEPIPCSLGCGGTVSIARQACGVTQCCACLPDVTPVNRKHVTYTDREAAILIYSVEDRPKTDVLRQFIEKVMK